MKELTPRQIEFVRHLRETDGNRTEAARRAGYKAPERAAVRNWHNPSVREAYEHHLRTKQYVEPRSLDDAISRLWDLVDTAGNREKLGALKVIMDFYKPDPIPERPNVNIHVSTTELQALARAILGEAEETPQPRPYRTPHHALPPPSNGHHVTRTDADAPDSQPVPEGGRPQPEQEAAGPTVADRQGRGEADTW